MRRGRRTSHPIIIKQRTDLGNFLKAMAGETYTPLDGAAMTLDLLASFDEKEYVLDVWKGEIRRDLLAVLREKFGHIYDLPDYKKALEQGEEANDERA